MDDAILLDAGAAISLVLLGYRVRRLCWVDGVVLCRGSSHPLEWRQAVGNSVTVTPCSGLGWFDMLGEDWIVAE
jgi:hypothetical protein